MLVLLETDCSFQESEWNARIWNLEPPLIQDFSFGGHNGLLHVVTWTVLSLGLFCICRLKSRINHQVWYKYDFWVHNIPGNYRLSQVNGLIIFSQVTAKFVNYSNYKRKHPCLFFDLQLYQQFQLELFIYLLGMGFKFEVSKFS